MKVIFLKSIPNVASAGDIKEVADGFGRNYLLPQKLAVLATTVELRRVEAIRKAEARRVAKAEDELAKLARTLENTSLTFRAKVGSKDRLYGSITSADIAAEIQKVVGYEVDKRKVEMEEPIRQTGEFQVAVKLSKDLVPRVKVIVQGEAPQGETPENEQREVTPE